MMEIWINQERCKGCDLCLNCCPKGVFQETPKIGSKGFRLRMPVSPEKCNECGLCQYFCPDAAIVLNTQECLIDEFWRKARDLKELAIAQNHSRGGWKKVKTHFPGRHLISGNAAYILAAIDAGCSQTGTDEKGRLCFFGYPITPSREGEEEAAEKLPLFGGTFLQAETEDSSVAMMNGACCAGAKTLTTTSGPGFSRMQENLGFALTNELPMVIVDAQRTGPSTGRPTATGGGDIREARWGSHGGTEHIVLYIDNVSDAYFKMIEAFNLSEMFRVPVILMTEESVVHLEESIEIPAEIDVFNRIYQPGAAPFGPTADGSIPSMPKFGEGEFFKLTGLTHNQWGAPCPNDPEIHEAMVMWQREKIVSKIDELIDIGEYWMEDADIAIIACGFTARSAKWAVKRARAEGSAAVGLLQLKGLFPFPEEKIKELSRRVRCILVPEMNQGQLFYVVREVSFAPVISLPQPDGQDIEPDRILDFLRKTTIGKEYYRDTLYAYNWARAPISIYNPPEWQREEKEIPERNFVPETIFCAGCGLGIERNCLLEAIKELNLDIRQVVVISGIGCSSRLPNHLPFDSANTTHGYPIAFATGVKLARPELIAIVTTGDGDFANIGAGQAVHGAKRDIPMVVLCFNNFNFGMTGGQAGATTPLGAKTSIGTNKEKPFDLVKLMLASGARFAARCPTSKPVFLKYLIKSALEHNGFAFIELDCPCLAQYVRRNERLSPAQVQKKLNEAYISKAKAEKLSLKEFEEKFRTMFPFRKDTSVEPEELLQLVYGKFSNLTEYVGLIPKEKGK